MDWLDKTIGDFEEKERNRKNEAEEERKKLEADIADKKEKSSKAIGTIHEQFIKMKKRLKQKGYESDSRLKAHKDINSGNQFNNETILIVRNKPMVVIAELGKTNSPYIQYSAKTGSDELSVEIQITESLKSLKKQSVPIFQVNDEYIDGEIQNFVKQAFS